MGIQGAEGDGKLVAIYARSAADDEAGTACRDQVRRARGLIKPPVRAAVYADPGRSGLDAYRPGLLRLRADARRRSLCCVIVRDLPRLARSATLLESILRELREAGVDIRVIDEERRNE